MGLGLSGTGFPAVCLALGLARPCCPLCLTPYSRIHQAHRKPGVKSTNRRNSGRSMLPRARAPPLSRHCTHCTATEGDVIAKLGYSFSAVEETQLSWQAPPRGTMTLCTLALSLLSTLPNPVSIASESPRHPTRHTATEPRPFENRPPASLLCPVCGVFYGSSPACCRYLP